MDFQRLYVCWMCVCLCVCVVISSSLFYEYMNIFNGHLSQGRFPDDKFPGKGMIHSPAVHGYCRPCFLCILSPRKIRTTASVFDYGYFKTKFIFFCPLRLRIYTCGGRARQGYVHRNHFYHNHREATFFLQYLLVFMFFKLFVVFTIDLLLWKPGYMPVCRYRYNKIINNTIYIFIDLIFCLKVEKNLFFSMLRIVFRRVLII